jgi:hypothetical protein
LYPCICNGPGPTQSINIQAHPSVGLGFQLFQYEVSTVVCLPLCPSMIHSKDSRNTYIQREVPVFIYLSDHEIVPMTKRNLPI